MTDNYLQKLKQIRQKYGCENATSFDIQKRSQQPLVQPQQFYTIKKRSVVLERPSSISKHSSYQRGNIQKDKVSDNYFRTTNNYQYQNTAVPKVNPEPLIQRNRFNSTISSTKSNHYNYNYNYNYDYDCNNYSQDNAKYDQKNNYSKNNTKNIMENGKKNFDNKNRFNNQNAEHQTLKLFRQNQIKKDGLKLNNYVKGIANSHTVSPLRQKNTFVSQYSGCPAGWSITNLDKVQDKIQAYLRK